MVVDALAAFLAADDDAPPLPDYGPPPLTEEYVAALRRESAAAPDDDRYVMQLPIAPAWYEDAACVDMDTETFHDADAEAVAAALAVCASCPVMTSCRDMAVADASLIGVWGGQTERERAEARRQGAQVRRRPRRDHARPLAGPVQPCGTTAAYQRHRRRGEPACEYCKDAKRAEIRARRARAATQAA